VKGKPINEFVLIHCIKVYVTCRMAKDGVILLGILNVNNVKTCCDPDYLILKSLKTNTEKYIGK